MPDLLFEIGTEELPPDSIHSLIEQIQANITKELTKNYIYVKEEEITTFSTPRRIAVYIPNLPKVQEIKTIEIKGPGSENALAITAFAKKYNLEAKDLIRKKINNIEYVFAITKVGGKETKQILSDILPLSIRQTTANRLMSWGNCDEKFIRPIRWILAVLDSEVIDFTYAGIKSTNQTYGHRLLAKGSITIHLPIQYEKVLEEHFVIANYKKRRGKIEAMILNEAEKINSHTSLNLNLLLDTVTNITEYPCSLLCDFNKEFLELPAVVIETVLVKHQKSFALFKRNRTDILPNFVVITNGTEIKNKEAKYHIKAGNEKVVKARLRDAQFFYKEDLKTPFTYEVKKEKLSKITFQKGLGSMEEKVLRIIKLSEYIYENLEERTKIKVKRESIIETAKLCKLDLTTNMVFEFTELQGEIGSIYAKANKYNEEISKGIQEHYYPRHIRDKYPESTSGIIVGISDKLDNITCLFLSGKIPSGSADPFSLRRQAQAIIEIILTKNLKLDLEKLIDFSVDSLLKTQPQCKIEIKNKKTIKEFLINRFTTIMEGLGYETDLINSVSTINNLLCDIILAKEKIHALEEIFILNKKEEFKSFLIAAKRLVRIVEEKTNGNLTISDLQSEYEKSLYNRFKELDNKITANQHFKIIDFLTDLASLTIPINTFFDNILVNDPNPKIKQSRQALLKRGKDLFEKICDFNQIIERP